MGSPDNDSLRLATLDTSLEEGGKGWREAPTTTPSVSLRSRPPSEREARKENNEKASPGRRGRTIS